MINLSKYFDSENKPNIPLFQLGIMGIFLFSLTVRFWGLSRFNTLVFDEVHFAKFANNYLIHQQFFENHPPLGKYFIAIGIWLSNFFHWGGGETNNLTGSSLTSFSYRWMNALIGSFIPVVISAIAYQLTNSRFYSLIAGLLMSLEGLFLVESRYALINIYLIIFGLLGQWFLLLATVRSHRQKQFFLIIAGICFGASFAVKWNGLAFLLGIYLLWIVAKIIEYYQTKVPQNIENTAQNLFHKLAKLHIIDIIVELGIIPLITYIIVWIPHLQLNNNMNFWEWQKYLYESQKSVGNGPNVHPYCSPWYSWIGMIRPIAYYFEVVKQPSKQTGSISLFSPYPPPTEIYYDVHAIGNPILWWLSTGAIALLLVLLIQRLLILNSSLITKEQKISLIQSPSFGIFVYLLLNYLANLLPWISVTRCTFLYHYMGGLIFAILAIAWLIYQSLLSDNLGNKILGLTGLFLIVIAFIYWLPIYLGLPLEPLDFESRMWFRSWY